MASIYQNNQDSNSTNLEEVNDIYTNIENHVNENLCIKREEIDINADSNHNDNFEDITKNHFTFAKIDVKEELTEDEFIVAEALDSVDNVKSERLSDDLKPESKTVQEETVGEKLCENEKALKICTAFPKKVKISTGHNKLYECRICKRKFRVPTRLFQHIRLGCGQKLFDCKICTKKFNQSIKLDAHMRIHAGEMPYECNVCGKKFNYLSNRDTHMRIHSGEKPFDCNVCGKKFNQSSHRDAHVRIHSEKKQFECNVCGKQFNYSNNRDIHIRTHSGEKPFACHVCGKKFSQSSNRDAHMRIHSGERPFDCNICGKKFNQSSNRDAHIKIHARERPFECSVCGKIFRDEHLQTHYDEKSVDYYFCCEKFNNSNTRNAHL